MNSILEQIGIDPGILIIVLLVVVLVLIFITASLSLSVHRLNRKYTAFMKGKDGKTLEESLLSKFSEIDGLAKLTKQNRQDVKDIYRKMEKDFKKVGIVKYDAFNEMGGKLSFALAMLDGNNSGWVINAMHSREGCYTYIKEIVKGESYVELAEEETEALDRAIFSEAYSMDVKETRDTKKRTNKSEKDEV